MEEKNEKGRVKNLFKGKKVKKRLAPWKGKTKSEKSNDLLKAEPSLKKKVKRFYGVSLFLPFYLLIFF